MMTQPVRFSNKNTSSQTIRLIWFIFY